MMLSHRRLASQAETKDGLLQRHRSLAQPAAAPLGPELPLAYDP